jgi:hypothetical protein
MNEDKSISSCEHTLPCRSTADDTKISTDLLQATLQHYAARDRHTATTTTESDIEYHREVRRTKKKKKKNATVIYFDVP